MSNGVHYSPCKLKIKINQTLKLISFPSVGSAVPVRCLPACLAEYIPASRQGWAAQAAAQVCDKLGEDAGTSFQPWEIGKSGLGRVPKPKAQYWAWKGNRQEETLFWSKGNTCAGLGGRTLGNTPVAIIDDIMSLGTF